MFNIAGKSVFIAETSENMRSYKQNIIKELQHLGCNIKLLSYPHPNIDAYQKTINSCDVAIHILSDDDKIFGNDEIGFEEKQIEYSIQHLLSKKLASSNSNFEIIGWHPKINTKAIYEEEKVSIHIQNIQQHDELELLRTTFEEFKNYLFKKNNLKSHEFDEVEKSNDSKGVLSIYFIYDLKDIESAEKYTSYFKNYGFKVYNPMFTTDILKVRQQHNNYLKKCDITIIFSSGTNVNWVNMKIMDVLKSPGLGRKNTTLENAVFMLSEMQNKIPLLNRGFEFIEYKNNTSTDLIEQFLKKASKN